MSDRVRLALIGAGEIANAMHYPSLAEFPDVELAGLCDLEPERLRATADRFGIQRTFTDYRRMLDEVEAAAVYLILPPFLVLEPVLECLDRGFHVFIEKPPGVSAAETGRMADRARLRDRLSMVGFQRRFCPLLVESRRRVEERGPVIQCGARYLKNRLGARPYYDGRIDMLTCDVIHAVDILRWMGGEVRRVVSDIGKCCADYENAFNALLKFESGAVGFLMNNWAVGKRTFSVELHARGISAYAEPDDRAVFYQDNRNQGTELASREAAGSDRPHHYLGFRAENRHFIDCIKEKRQPLTNFEEAVRSMELVELVRRSAW
ncbi:MAG TPA: Gfo/Idh/MocA family oxidoreductase [bacterium]|nr:Gfo/Idh/MocA family oxidoreductase [bacterium]HNS49039.1 Gfo/Idh/MocA family oxidoreductase [bacterium]